MRIYHGPNSKIIDQKYNRWTVISFAFRKKSNNYYNCRCSCGVEKVVAYTNLKYEKSKSCGCLRNEETTKRLTTHNKSYSRIYWVWNAMINRCLNSNANSFKNYGGRGITVCKEWLTFENFYNDMGTPLKGSSLDRIDNEKGYCKENCSWTNRSSQNRNRRSNIYIEFEGKKQCAKDWAKEYNLPDTIVSQRIRNGWEPSEAILTPVRKIKNGKN